MRAGVLRRVGLAMLLTLPSMAAFAKTTTIDDVTVDVPEGYEVASSKRGLLIKSSDKEVDLWIELFSAADTPTVRKEHMDYWKKEKVDLHGDGDTTKSKSGETEVTNTSFPGATWKGDPTVLHYNASGPFGSQNWTLLITYWASPDGDKQHGEAINKIVSDVKFKYPN
ncbi:MAG: hypothetical protein QOD35_3493 [Nocardioidaceae bacterium]|nr:hypothetical protein [Nocardioidaceae bacterium]